MITQDAIQTLPGTQLLSGDGSKIGKIDDIYVDEKTGDLTFATVHTGLFGSKSSFVPMSEASFDGDRVSVPYATSKVKDAPSIEKDQELSPAEEQKLYSYYGITGEDTDRGYTEGFDAGKSDGFDADRFDADKDANFNTKAQTANLDRGADAEFDADGNAMVLSEEKLRVGTQKTEAGKARLKKYIVTENVTKTIPLSHEEVHIERESIQDGTPANAENAFKESEYEISLTAEKPVVTTEAVAVERIKMNTVQVNQDVTVNGEVRKERLDLDTSGLDNYEGADADTLGRK